MTLRPTLQPPLRPGVNDPFQPSKSGLATPSLTTPRYYVSFRAPPLACGRPMMGRDLGRRLPALPNSRHRSFALNDLPGSVCPWSWKLTRSIERRWYVVRVVSRSEERARSALTQAGFGVYLPTRQIERQHRRTKAWRCWSEPLMLGYLFVEFPEVSEREFCDRGRTPTWRALKSCSAVLHPLGQVDSDGTTTPMPVPSSVVEDLMAGQASMLFDETRAANKLWRDLRKVAADDLAHQYPVGSEIVAGEGPFAGMVGSVTAVSPNGMVEALLSLFGRLTPVSFPVEQIQPNRRHQNRIAA